ncbi:hypothetical protein ACOME3_002018 [Neoechinorhynchus agilis]
MRNALVKAKRTMICLVNVQRRDFFYNYWRARRGIEGAKEIKDEISSIPIDVRILQTIKLLWGDTMKLCKELKEVFTSTPRLIHYHGDCTPVYTFDGTDEPLNNWMVASDRPERIGESWARVELSPNKRWLIFSGYLDGGYDFDLSQAISSEKNIEPIKVRGLAAMVAKGDRMPFRIGNKKFEWAAYTHIGLRLRGDGRCYTLILNMPGYYQELAHEMYVYPLHTRGGPYWQDVRIPFAKLALANKGVLKDIQPEKKYMSSVTGITISLMDNITGPV